MKLRNVLRKSDEKNEKYEKKWIDVLQILR